MKSFLSLIVIYLSLSWMPAVADGSTTASQGSVTALSGSIAVVAGGAEVLAQVVLVSGYMVVDSVALTGELTELTLRAVGQGLETSSHVVINLTSASLEATALVVGSVLEITTVVALTGSHAIGHLLLFGGEVLMFVPHKHLIMGMHSEKL